MSNSATNRRKSASSDNRSSFRRLRSSSSGPFGWRPERANGFWEISSAARSRTRRSRVFIPSGKLDEAVGKGLRLGDEQIRINFDIANARMNVAGDIPPIRDTSAAFRSDRPEGDDFDHRVARPIFASGRSVGLGEGQFVLPSTLPEATDGGNEARDLRRCRMRWANS